MSDPSIEASPGKAVGEGETNRPETGAFNDRDLSWHPPALAWEYRSSRLRSPKHAPLKMPQTVSEVTGPVFSPAILGPLDHDLIHNYAATGQAAIGPRIIVHGRVVDEQGRGVPGALVEVWQANAGGRYRHANEGYIAPLDPNFGGCGRVITGPDGDYEFWTVLPGPYPWPNRRNDWRPAHIHFSVFGEGWAQRLITQMYFEGDPLIRLCPIVGAIPSDDAVETLIAKLDMERTVPMDARAYRFDIVLRGRRQTMFENRTEGL
ncbi:MAG: protocatechuate 3,4-dioxygenase subunit beta [Pseudomonadota bacterium]